MDVLLDEGVPHKLRRALQEKSIQNTFVTVQNMGLTGNAPDFELLNPIQKDRKLLLEAKSKGFNVLITVDKSMEIEQKFQTPINVLTIDMGRDKNQTFENIAPLIPQLNERLLEIEAAISRGEAPCFSRIGQAGMPPLDPDDV